MLIKFHRKKLSDIFVISTESINPSDLPNKSFFHYSIPAYDEKRIPALEKGSEIKSNKYLLKKDSLLVSKLNPRINRVWKYKYNQSENMSVCSTEFIVYQTDNDDVDLDFYYHFFRSDIFQKELLNLQSGTTGSRMRVTPSDTLSIEIPVPNIKEQRKIAAILTSVDKAIEKTEAIIQQTEKVKKGLMQQLLTKGIGHTKFKKTEIGEIPVEWRAVKLGEVCDIIMGQSPKGDTYNTDGLGSPLLNGPTEFGEVHPTPVKWTTKPTKFCAKGDILVCVRGSSTGRMNVADQVYCIGRGLAAIRGKSDIVNQDFLMFHIERLSGEILGQATGSTFPNIDKARLSNFDIPLPPIHEQQKISRILLSIVRRRELELKKVRNLQVLKDSLMKVLLSGKVRVEVDEDAEVVV